MSDEAWLDRCRRFADEVMRPAFASYDRDNSFPRSIHAAGRTWGMIDQDLPVHLGGAGLDGLSACEGAEILASVCAPSAFTLGFNRGALHPVLRAGTPAQQERFVGELVRDQGYASLCLTEPDVSGSNLMGLQTTAHRTATGWVLSGTKSMVGNAGVAELFLVLARTVVDGSARGLTFFAVPRSAAVEVGPNTDKLGFRAVETPQVRFDEVELDDDHRIGAVGSGTAVMVDTLDCIRVGGAAVILGIVVGALNDALPWIQSREVYGGTLEQKSHVQLALGDIYGRLLSTRAMVVKAAELRDAGQPYGLEAGVAKLHAAQLAQETTAKVSQLFGWRGIDGAWPIQKRFRDARQTSIFEGTSEVQQRNLFRTLQRRARGGSL